MYIFNLLFSVSCKAVKCHHADESKKQRKIFNDPIHGHIEFHPLCVAIIDTPQFQRLRRIKQLGAGYYVYPGASHNRFEHSLGVGYLAGEFTKKLKVKQEEDKQKKDKQEKEKESADKFDNDVLINDEDVLCVTIAGLCHDMGHGPFSHLFDGQFIKRCDKNSKWKHEKASVEMFQHMIDENNLMTKFKDYKLNERDVKFIKELIDVPANELKREGRDRKKFFLYEIVSNKRNGIDVDKWDYFARDCHHLGIRNNFDHRRFMEFAKVVKTKNDEYHISIRDKEAANLYDMFCTRNTLHRRAYRHKTTVIIEHMLTDALYLANDCLTFSYKDKHGKTVTKKLSETIGDMKAYEQVTDDVYGMIRYSQEPPCPCDCQKPDSEEDKIRDAKLKEKNKKLKEAKKILEKIERRELYKYVGQSKPKDGRRLVSSGDIRKKISALCDGIDENDIIVEINSFNFGMGDMNPMQEYEFYSKQNKKGTFKLEAQNISGMIPRTFREDYMIVYSKKGDKESVKKLTKGFKSYCKEYDFDESKGGL